MKTIFLILLASSCMAASPKRSFDDSALNDELENIYYQINSVTSKGFRGRTTGATAATGYVGETVSSVRNGDDNYAANNVFDDLLSISLTPGNWSISAATYSDNSGATWTSCQMGISPTSGNDATGLIRADNNARGAWASSATTPTAVTLGVSEYPVSITTTTTYYLKRMANYSAGTPITRGARITATRKP